MVTLASEPDGFERTEIVPVASLGARPPARRRRPAAGRRDLADASTSGGALEARFDAPRGWPRAVRAARPGADGPVARPVLGAAPARPRGSRAATTAARSTARAVYAEKNWGAAFADHWWWGQGPGVAFAGGRIHGVAPTAVVAWTDRETIALAPPFARTVARAGGGEWHIRAHSRALADRDRGRGGRRAAAAGPAAGRAPARAALQPPPDGRARGARAGAAGGCGCAASGLAGLEDGAVSGAWVMTSSAMSSSPPSARAELAQHVVADRVRRQPHVAQRAARSCSSPTSIERERSSISPSV